MASPILNAGIFAMAQGEINSAVVVDIQNLFQKINLQIFAGEFLVVFGANGSGKTLILKVIAGLVSPEFGSCVSPLSKAKIGMTFQRGGLFDSMTVEENMLFVIQERVKTFDNNTFRKVEENLKKVELWDSKHNSVSSLSGGMQKRLGLARALILEPELILYDEPTAGLDPLTAETIFNFLVDEHRLKKNTTVLATCEYRKAYAHADRIVVLEDCSVAFVGNQKEFLENTDPRVQVYQ